MRRHVFTFALIAARPRAGQDLLRTDGVMLLGPFPRIIHTAADVGTCLDREDTRRAAVTYVAVIRTLDIVVTNHQLRPLEALLRDEVAGNVLLAMRPVLGRVVEDKHRRGHR